MSLIPRYLSSLLRYSRTTVPAMSARRFSTSWTFTQPSSNRTKRRRCPIAMPQSLGHATSAPLDEILAMRTKQVSREPSIRQRQSTSVSKRCLRSGPSGCGASLVSVVSACGVSGTEVTPNHLRYVITGSRQLLSPNGHKTQGIKSTVFLAARAPQPERMNTGCGRDLDHKTL